MAEQNVVGGFDRVFKHVGSNGKFQYLLLLTVSLQCIILSWHHLSYVFLGAVPDHWCYIPELVGSGWTNDQIRNLSIPLKINGQGWESCEYYNHNYAHLASLPYEKALLEASREEVDDVGRLSCQQGWSFDRHTYESTLVTQFEIVCDNRYLVATIQASYMGGVFIGSLILGSLSDQIIGRRKSVLISIILVIVGGIAATFSRSYWELIFCRFFVAFGVAGAYQNCYVLLMEYAGTTSRSAMGMIQQLPFAMGYMIMAGYAYFLRDWKTLQFAYSITAIVLLSYFWILPESARWLAVSGQTDKSLKLVMKVAKRNNKNVCREELYSIILSCDARDKKRSNPVTFRISDTPPPSRNVCFEWTRKVWHPLKKTLSIYMSLLATPEMRRRTLVIWFLFISVDLVYYGVVFDSATLTNDPYLLVFLGGLTEVPAYTLVVPILSRWGRRPTIVASYFLTAVCTLTVAYISEDQEILRMVVSMSGKLFITTCFAVIYLLGTELYPTSTRTTGLAAAVFMGRIGSILAPYVVDGMKNVYRDLPNIIFGIVCVISGAVSFLIPETNDLEMADKLHDVEEGYASKRRRSHKSDNNFSPIPYIPKESVDDPLVNGT
ncbi:unnamed protein product [Orchesella dallaii]|uniref:Major facilitator superfamily (MFS) profile domain-containing protein n=1 Tax=Orchesella dallaii TaxID=48710 RepID=A0ABP1R2G2_9HEXA